MILKDGKYNVGIDSQYMNHFVHAQKRDQLCWAASIQTILKFYGIFVSQEDIVIRTFGIQPDGFIPNWGANYQQIHYHLNNWDYKIGNQEFQLRASFGEGAPNIRWLIQELIEQRPILIGYHVNPGVGHAVVITAVDFFVKNGDWIVTKIVVRDPFPSDVNKCNNGRVEYGGKDLAKIIGGYWGIRVIRIK
jgi:hypothetical protein